MKRKQFDEVSTKRLYAAIRSNNVDEFQAINDEGYPIATATFGESRATALIMAVNRKDIQLVSVKKLIELGSSITAVDTDGSAPLHVAALNPDNNPQTQAAIIVYLVRKGATLEGNAHLDMLDNSRDKPIDCARQNENESVRELFVDSFMRAICYANTLRETIATTQAPSQQRKFFNDSMENDKLYDDMMRTYDQTMQAEATAKTGGGFTDKEVQRRAGQATGNPLNAPLAANEGGFAGTVRQQQEEKKKEPCCVMM